MLEFAFHHPALCAEGDGMDKAVSGCAAPCSLQRLSCKEAFPLPALLHQHLHPKVHQQAENVLISHKSSLSGAFSFVQGAVWCRNPYFFKVSLFSEIECSIWQCWKICNSSRFHYIFTYIILIYFLFFDQKVPVSWQSLL